MPATSSSEFGGVSTLPLTVTLVSSMEPSSAVYSPAPSRNGSSPSAAAMFSAIVTLRGTTSASDVPMPAPQQSTTALPSTALSVIVSGVRMLLIPPPQQSLSVLALTELPLMVSAPGASSALE